MLTRRYFVMTIGAGALSPALLAAGRRLNSAQSPGSPPVGFPYVFFDPPGAQIIEAACERLIPADASGPGALAAGVPRYLDQQLSSAWGAGERTFREGPWQPGTGPPHRSMTATPAQIFRAALSVMRRAVQAPGTPYGAPFNELSTNAQDAYLRMLEAGQVPLGGVPSALFFEMLLMLTVEGFFSDPRYGSIRDRVAWRLYGFPGACATRSLDGWFAPPVEREASPRPTV